MVLLLPTLTENGEVPRFVCTPAGAVLADSSVLYYLDMWFSGLSQAGRCRRLCPGTIVCHIKL